jgi:hypothetical protein
LQQKTKDGLLQLAMKVDSKVNCNVRISMCVTENRNEINVPVMFYTPNKEDFVVNINLLPGLNQEIIFGEADFELSVLKKQNLTQTTHEYFPMVISINYNKDGQNNAFIAYFTFICDNKNRPSSTKLIKQCIIVNGLPFEIKSIYGLNAAGS